MASIIAALALLARLDKTCLISSKKSSYRLLKEKNSRCFLGCFLGQEKFYPALFGRSFQIVSLAMSIKYCLFDLEKLSPLLLRGECQLSLAALLFAIIGRRFFLDLQQQHGQLCLSQKLNILFGVFQPAN
jgi:hypothetical protein